VLGAAGARWVALAGIAVTVVVLARLGVLLVRQRAQD
jgi:ABC-type phosphate transport system auxiliary subunit